MKGRVVSLFSLGLVTFGFAGQSSTDFDKRLQDVCSKLEAERQKDHIVGMSLAVVKDGKVVLTKGFGYRDLKTKQPVDADTLFCIGSSTKAMTAATVMMAVEAGKVKLDANPNTYVPELHFYDPEIDKKITVSDVMSHRSGLTRVDLPWYTNSLSKDEIFQLVHDIQPTAKLGEKFQYQNIMFLVAGEIASRAFQTPYPELVSQKLFQPLGMARTTTNGDAAKDSNFAKGYGLNPFTGEPQPLRFHDIEVIAPAGAVISSANDMSKWLRLMLAKGTVDGKTFFTEDSYKALTTQHMTMAPTMGYGYGWMLSPWQKEQEVQHGGNIDGYSAMVAFLPKEDLGFVLLTNQNVSPLQNGSLATVFDTLVGKPAEATSVVAKADKPESEVGDYTLDKTPAFHIDVTFRGGKLYFHPTGQPNLEAIPDGGRIYHLAPPAPPVKITFIAAGKDGKKCFNLEQAGQTLVFKIADPYKAPISVDELVAKVETSQGDVSKWRSIKNLSVKFSDQYLNQGMKSVGAKYYFDQDKFAQSESMFAVGKRIGGVRTIYNGKEGWQILDFGAAQPISGAELAVARDQSYITPQLDWKKRYTKIEITGTGKVGDADVYKITCHTADGLGVNYQVDQKTGLILKMSVGGGEVEFQDYRSVDGLLTSFKQISNNPLGKSITDVLEIKVNGWIPPSILDAPTATAD